MERGDGEGFAASLAPVVHDARSPIAEFLGHSTFRKSALVSEISVANLYPSFI